MKCDKKMTFHECELTILRQAVDKIEKKNRKDSHKEPTNSRNYSNSRKFFEVKKTRMLWWNSYK